MKILLPFASLFVVLAACAGTTTDADSSNEAVHLGQAPDAGADADHATSDAGMATDSATDTDDGTPEHRQCTGTFGTGLVGGSHGRLDGLLVAIVPPTNSHTCSGDQHHLHLQIAMQGSTYDIAFNVEDVFFTEHDAPLADGPWSEGWKSSGAAFDFTTNLGLHSTDFESVPQDTLVPRLEALLANVNHISVFATKYASGGAHLVHHNGHGNDGAIVTEPLSGMAHYLLVRFPSQAF